MSEIAIVPLMGLVISTAEYSQAVHEGRRPGRRPPTEPLQLWAVRKLGLSGDEAWSAAFAIQRKIGKEGTEANPFMTRALERSETDIARIWKDVQSAIVRRLN